MLDRFREKNYRILKLLVERDSPGGMGALEICEALGLRVGTIRANLVSLEKAVLIERRHQTDATWPSGQTAVQGLSASHRPQHTYYRATEGGRGLYELMARPRPGQAG